MTINITEQQLKNIAEAKRQFDKMPIFSKEDIKAHYHTRTI